MKRQSPLSGRNGEEFLHRPKTRFDIKDRSRALLLFILIVAGLMWVVEKLTQ